MYKKSGAQQHLQTSISTHTRDQKEGIHLANDHLPMHCRVPVLLKYDLHVTI